MSQIHPHHREVKSALRRANLSGSFVVGKYSLSPYMACEHGCLYCDGRAERYWVDGDFDRDIVVRTNLPERLEAELPKLREKGFVSIGSGITDAYQPIEASQGLMARCAALLAQHDHPAVLMTKSSLALRDLETWTRLNERSRFVFVVSLAHADDGTRAEWEPRAAPVEKRVEALRRFKDAGCATGILAMPLLPHITDTDDNMRRLYDLAGELNVDFIMPGGLTLRPGRQKDTALSRLKTSHPELVSEWEHIYREERASGSPAKDYLEQLYPRFSALNTEYGLPWLVPHRIYREHLHTYDEVNVLLHHMIELYDARGITTRPLKTAMKKYLAWLTERKRAYNRHRSWRFADLDDELRALCAGRVDLAGGAPGMGTSEAAEKAESLASIIGNEKLAAFIGDVVLKRKVFDYVPLRLG